MALVFIGVVATDVLLARKSSIDVVGPASVIVWAFTLIGHFGIGPVRAFWNALH
jgi:hypothetical protein